MKNQIKTILLLGVLSAGLIAAAGMFGRNALYLATAFAAIMNVGAYFFSDRVVLKMSGARLVSPEEAPRLHRTVEELASAAGIPKPRVAVIEDAHANAFATGRNPEHGVVAVTTGILRLLSERELRGVLSHELAHIKNRDILIATIAAGLAAVISNLANLLQLQLLFGGGVLSDDGEDSSLVASLFFVLLAPIAALFVQMGVSRSREYLADAEGARISGDPEALARALEKLNSATRVVPGHAEPATASLFIVNPLSGAGLAHLFSTHPPMEERVRRLREMTYSRVA